MHLSVNRKHITRSRRENKTVSHRNPENVRNFQSLFEEGQCRRCSHIWLPAVLTA